jgi:hypothetical protein
MLTVAQLAPLKDRDPYLYETPVKIVASVNATSQRAGVDPITPAPAPPPIASVSVQASNGWFDISITDLSAARPGLFCESSSFLGYNPRTPSSQNCAPGNAGKRSPARSRRVAPS